ncbi:hypothetical protein AB832_07000 [Flavobacteriaceae bacterium (ex Bugula neritina AB1)]|nr:hypothetical protein AB832_07000 [Flavobacteriaceae bacterium (ex Bugula neritina AB1)]
MKQGQRQKNQKSRTQKKNNPSTIGGKVESNFIDSATILHGKDTNILQQDLFREFHPDTYDSDQGQLVNGKWVRFFGQDSSFLKSLMALITNAPTLRNIIDQKTTMTLGDGFVPVSSEKVPFLQTLRKLLRLSTAQDNNIEAVNDLIGCVNLYNESLDEVLKKISFDWWSFGNGIVELKKAKKEGKDVVYIYHVPLENVGIKKANKNNIIEAIGVCQNWDKEGFNEANIREIPMYPNFDSSGSSAIHIKNYNPNFFYWGLPSNVAGRFWAEIEYRIPKYNITKFQNGFTPSALIQAYGAFTPEDAKKLRKSFTDTFTDTGKNSKILLQVLRSKEDAADVHILEDKSEGNFLELQKMTSQGTVTSNGWTMSLTGIAQGGKLGTNQQIRDELEFVINTSIKPFRRYLEQKIVGPYIAENKKVNSDLGSVMLHIANSNPISMASLIRPTDALDRNELREILGYEPQEEQTVSRSENQEE